MRTYKVFRTKKAFDRPYRRTQDGNFPAGTIVIKVIQTENESTTKCYKYFLISEAGIMNKCRFKLTMDYTFWNQVINNRDESEWYGTFNDGEKDYEEFMKEFQGRAMYYSKSRGGYIFIDEMPDGHIRNAIKFNTKVAESIRNNKAVNMTPDLEEGLRRCAIENEDMRKEMVKREKEQVLLKEMDELMKTDLAQKWLRLHGYSQADISLEIQVEGMNSETVKAKYLNFMRELGIDPKGNTDEGKPARKDVPVTLLHRHSAYTK